jgi:hypothetical protein
MPCLLRVVQRNTVSISNEIEHLCVGCVGCVGGCISYLSYFACVGGFFKGGISLLMKLPIDLKILTIDLFFMRSIKN